MARKKPKLIDDGLKRDKDGYIILEFAEGKGDNNSSSKQTPSYDNDDGVTILDLGDYALDKMITASANINIGRALPWLEDGLKFVERRVLYTMFKGGWTANKPKAKVSVITGKMMETVYPHGDAAAAMTIYRLGRDYQAMIPYIDGGGGYGNAITMKAAAPRYATARLSKYSMDCFFSEEDGIAPIYDVKEAYEKQITEPIYLCTRFPNILMQWNFGIGKGASANFAAFNSTDIFEATLKLMDDPKAKIDIYPDTPAKLLITNKKDLRGCFDKKKFKVQVQAPYYVDKLRDKHGNDIHVIVFTSCPMQTTGKIIEEQIRRIKLEDEKKDAASRKLPEVLNQIPAIDKNGGPGDLQFTIEYEKGYDPHVLAEKLIKSTDLGKVFGVNYTLAHEYQPKEYTPREILLEWISIRMDQKRRYFTQKKKLASKEKLQSKALLTILEDKKHGGMDKCISIIRASTNDEETKRKLQDTFGLTEFQATIVMNLRLKVLNKANIMVEQDKYKKACSDYDKYTELCKEVNIREAIKEDLRYGLKTYGQKRRGKLMNAKDELLGSADEDKIIIYSKDTFYCLKSYDELPKIIKSIDRTFKVIRIKSGDNLVLFNSMGKMRVLNGYAFNYTDTGISMEKVAFNDVVNISVISDIAKSELAFITRLGYGKVLKYADIGNSVKGKVINLNQGDELISVTKVEKDGILGLIDGDNVYYMKVDNIPVLKRSASGNRLIKSKSSVNVTGSIHTTGEHPYLLVYGESGYIKILDTSFLTFNTRKPNIIAMKGKNVYNLVPIDKNGSITLYGAKGSTKMDIKISDKVVITDPAGKTRNVKLATSIGDPTKLLSVGKHEFYQLI